MSPIYEEGSGRGYDLNELVGEPVRVDDEVLRQLTNENDFSALAFELYKEAGEILAVCSHSFLGYTPSQGVLGRDQAICAGLLIRVVKYMTAVMQLVSANPDREEVVLALNRCISESAINARFLADKNERRFYDQFVEFSLGPEKELYDTIISNIEARGGKPLPIENRMLESIRRVSSLSGFKIEDVRPKHPDWGGGLRNRLQALGEPEMFVAVGRVLSHAVHGTWVDLILNHLREKDGGFAPEPSWSRVDSRLMLPVCPVVLESAYSYLRRFLGEHPELNSLYERIADLQARIGKVDQAHEAWIEARGQGTA